MNYQDLARKIVPYQKIWLNDLMKKSGLLQSALYEPSNLGDRDVQEVFTSVASGNFRNLAGGVTVQDVDTKLVETQLLLLSLAMRINEDYVKRIGGFERAIASRLPALLEGMGQTAAKQLFYGGTTDEADSDGFYGLRKLAINYGNIINKAGTGGTGIYAVKWERGRSSLVYNSMVVGSANDAGSLFSLTQIADGNVISEYNSSTGKEYYFRKALIDTQLALRIATDYCVGAIVNVDSSHKPTLDNLVQLIDMVKGSPTDTVIYVSRLGRRYIRALKEADLMLDPSMNDYSSYVGSIEGVKVMLDENIKDVETDYSA